MFRQTTDQAGYIKFRVNADAIRKAVKEQCTEPIIALSKNNAVMYQIGQQAINLLDQYVPKDTGALRNSAHIVQHARSTEIRYGSPQFGKTDIYADIQYWRDVLHPEWHYTTKGTMGEWFKMLEPDTLEYQQLVEYATNLMRKAVKK